MKTALHSPINELDVLKDSSLQDSDITVSGFKSDGTWYSGKIHQINSDHIIILDDEEEKRIDKIDIATLNYDFRTREFVR